MEGGHSPQGGYKPGLNVPCAHVGVLSPIFVNLQGKPFLKVARASSVFGALEELWSELSAKKNKKREIEPPITKIVKMQF